MKKIALHIAIILLTFAANAQLFPDLGGQRAGISALTFLKNDLSPRSMGMGGTSVANLDDPFAMTVNPAAAAGTENYTIGVSNLRIANALNQQFLTGIIPHSASGAFMGGLNVLNSQKMIKRTTFQPEGTGEYFYATNAALSAGYSRRLSQMFSFGVNIHYLYEQIAEYYDHTMGIDLGFLYRTDWRGFNFAVTVRNFGINSTLETNDEFQFAFAETQSNINDASPTNEFRFGASIIVWEQEYHQLRAALQLNHPNDNSENIRIGTEYNYREIFYGRTGLLLNVQGYTLPTLGFGFRSNKSSVPIQIDASFATHEFLGFQSNVGIAVFLAKKNSNDEER